MHEEKNLRCLECVVLFELESQIIALKHSLIIQLAFLNYSKRTGPQLGRTSRFFLNYGDWSQFECKEKSTLSSLMLPIAGGVGGLVLLLIIYLLYRFCCKKSEKSNMVFYPTEHDVSERTDEEIEMEIRAKDIRRADDPRMQIQDSLDAIQTPTIGMQSAIDSDDLTAV